MGGDVALESTLGAGSRFRVHLPLPPIDPTTAPPPVEEDAALPGDAILPGRPLRILIVEDNRINRVVLRGLLEQDGHHVDEAHDGQQGVLAVQETSYDLVFMDISMPVMDGVEATRTIRQAEGPGTRLPLVALTAHARATDKERFRAAGLDEILVKPISRKGLRAVIATHFSPQHEGDCVTTAPPPREDVLDRPHLADLSDALGQARITTLIAEFIAETEAALEAIAHRVGHGDIAPDLAPQIHQLAGSSALVGAVALRETLVALEDRVAQGGVMEARDAPVLREVWQATRDALTTLSRDGQDALIR